MHLLYDFEDVESLIQQQPDMVSLLSAVASLQLPDGYISAGFVRNAVWDALHLRPISCATLRDVDVVYYDPEHHDPEAERQFERELTKLIPGVPWEVRNQARMHLRNGDPPYHGTIDAVRHYPETATAVAARLVDGRVLRQAGAVSRAAGGQEVGSALAHAALSVGVRCPIRSRRSAARRADTLRRRPR